MGLTMTEIRIELAGLQERRSGLVRDLQTVQGRIRTSTGGGGDHERVLRLRSGIANLDTRESELQSEVEHLAERTDEVLRQYAVRGGTEEGSTPERSRTAAEDDGLDPYRRDARDGALRCIEANADVLSARAADSLDAIVRHADPMGATATYLRAVADPAYGRAFVKMLADPMGAQHRMTPEENASVQTASRAMSLTGASGGFAVPFTLDPSISFSSSGAINPIRSLARVEQIVTDQWKGVTSAGVTAAYAAEATETSDNSPTLAQPVIDAARGQAFVPFSIEVGMDWGTLAPEMAALLQDARDVVDATQMLSGNGSDAPGGILNIGGTGGLTTTQRVLTAGTAAYAIADVYSLKQAIPPRWSTTSTYVMSATHTDTTWQFVAAGDATDAPIMSPSRDAILGRPLVEWSTMSTAVTSGSKIAIYGDWANYLIADRIGSTIELIPHLFGASGRPTGQRGFFFFWRTGSGTLVPNAFRYLQAA